ncbi:hypothetical protein RFI_28393 [Reticulomyxa filosa]|uniref:Uncharacterized protein n=1 Tax=Reticulomyxa filosa TaxID=46433 RepID=X6M514_RETFI|nr:hypothetical protein RFI_28393 [Reticulomyxa filosa]|eukprot:ETO08994.1 hypothetical protein RFI_28393 [Reticulomyxa filosa]
MKIKNGDYNFNFGIKFHIFFKNEFEKKSTILHLCNQINSTSHNCIDKLKIFCFFSKTSKKIDLLVKIHFDVSNNKLISPINKMKKKLIYKTINNIIHMQIIIAKQLITVEITATITKQ